MPIDGGIFALDIPKISAIIRHTSPGVALPGLLVIAPDSTWERRKPHFSEQGDSFMRLLRAFGVLSLAVFWASSLGAQSPLGGSFPGACPLPTLPNVNQLALLRWYDANTVNTIPTGGSPNGIAFDGANIWLVNGPPNSVTKLRANDGAVLGTFPLGNVPGYAAFDGVNIWITNLLDQTVSK